MQQVIKTIQLSKSYKGLQAVKNISLSINRGEIYGFIGLNGAGKTTTIKMLLGMIRPTSGTCLIKGKQVRRSNRQILKNIGYMVETPHSYPELTVEDNLHIIKKIRLLSDRNVVPKVMDQLHLSRYAQTKAGNLSLGNAQRLGIAKALLHSPEILILDEPMNGLDPAGIIEIRELLQDLAFSKGVTILISSHLLSEITKIATKVGIIHEGQMIQEIKSNTLNQLLHKHLAIDTRNNGDALSKLSIAGYDPVLDESKVIKTSNQKAIKYPDEISRLLVNKGLPPTRLSIEKENLESYFLRIIRKGEK